MNVRIVLRHDPQALTLPAAAVQRSQDGTFVWLIGADKKAVNQPVKVASIQDGLAVIASGVQAGQRVATDGQYKLKPGIAVSEGASGAGPRRQRRRRGREWRRERGHRRSERSARVNVSAGFIRRPIGTTLLAIAILLVGAAVFPLLPVAPLPQVDFPTIQVTASLPGASPETMASNVAQPLERQFSLIAGLAQMTSTSGTGQTQITLQFDLNRAIDAAAVDVQAAINASTGQLPANLPSPPTFRKVNPADSPIMLLAVQSKTLPLIEVNDYADNILAQQISQISGVGLVNIGGAQKPAVRVQIDATKLAALGLSLEDIRGVIATISVNAPKGTVDGASQSFTVYTNDQLLKAAPWNDVVLAYRNGAAVRVRDVGVAVDAPENNKVAAWSYAGRRVARQHDPERPRHRAGHHQAAGANVIETVDAIKAALPKLQAAIPPTVEVNILVDRTQTIRASVHDVEMTLLLTIALVVLVIFIFLRSVPATLIPSVTVPLALMGTAAIMYVVGFSLDNLSLMALTIAVGFVVDDAIVMLENIYRYVEDGMSRWTRRSRAPARSASPSSRSRSRWSRSSSRCC